MGGTSERERRVLRREMEASQKRRHHKPHKQCSYCGARDFLRRPEELGEARHNGMAASLVTVDRRRPADRYRARPAITIAISLGFARWDAS